MSATTYRNDAKQYDRGCGIRDMGLQACVVLMPSHEGLDVMLYKDKGIIDHTTRQFWIEKNRNKIQPLKNLRDNLGFKGGNVTILNMALEDFVPPQKVNFINADMECQFNAALGCAIEKNLLPQMAEGGTMLLNVVKKRRRNGFVQDGFRVFCEQNMEIMCRRAKQKYKSDDEIWLPLLGISCVLREYSYHIEGNQYGGCGLNTDMLSWRISNIRHAGSSRIWPPFSEMAAKWDETRNLNSYNPGTKDRRIAILRSHLEQRGHSLTMNGGKWEVVFSAYNAIITHQTLDDLCSLFKIQ